MSSLLTDHKKKTSGMTSYQRPGPPTPSKHSRLSLGGMSVDSGTSRDPLKENYDPNRLASSSKKTPARFNIFSSKFSMGAPKEEVSVFRCLFSVDNSCCDNTFNVNNNDLDSID